MAEGTLVSGEVDEAALHGESKSLKSEGYVSELSEIPGMVKFVKGDIAIAAENDTGLIVGVYQGEDYHTIETHSVLEALDFVDQLS